MGTTLVNGRVISKSRDYLKVIIDERNDFGYDFIKMEGAAIGLGAKSSFSLYVTLKSCKIKKGCKVNIYGDPTLTPDLSKPFDFEFTMDQVIMLKKAIKRETIAHRYLYSNDEVYEKYKERYEKESKDLRIILQMLERIIPDSKENKNG